MGSFPTTFVQPFRKYLRPKLALCGSELQHSKPDETGSNEDQKGRRDSRNRSAVRICEERLTINERASRNRDELICVLLIFFGRCRRFLGTHTPRRTVNKLRPNQPCQTKKETPKRIGRRAFVTSDNSNCFPKNIGVQTVVMPPTRLHTSANLIPSASSTTRAPNKNVAGNVPRQSLST